MLMAEHQSTRMSKITNGCLTRSGTRCFIEVATGGVKGLNLTRPISPAAGAVSVIHHTETQRTVVIATVVNWCCVFTGTILISSEEGETEGNDDVTPVSVTYWFTFHFTTALFGIH